MFYNPLYKPHNRGKARGMSVAGGDEAPPGLPSLGSVRICYLDGGARVLEAVTVGRSASLITSVWRDALKNGMSRRLQTPLAW